MLLVPSKFLTVSPKWQLLWRMPQLDTYSGVGGDYRILFKLANGFSFSGRFLRFTFAANAIIPNNFTTTGVRVGKWDGTIGPNYTNEYYGGSANYTTLTFTGLPGFSIAPNAMIKSDTLPFNFVQTDSIIVEFNGFAGACFYSPGVYSYGGGNSSNLNWGGGTLGVRGGCTQTQ